MSCEEVQRQLTALLDGELRPGAASEIEAHLAECAACSEACDEIRAVLAMTQAWNVEGGAVLAGVQQQISQDEMRALLLEMKRLRGEVVALRSEVTELKIRMAQRDATIGQGNSDFLRFPCSAAKDTVRLIL